MNVVACLIVTGPCTPHIPTHLLRVSGFEFRNFFGRLPHSEELSIAVVLVRAFFRFAYGC
jgi:hypothetical protein